MNPTPEQIAKLPKWAQEHIESLSRELASQTSLSKRMVDDQTPSEFFVDEWYSTPSVKRYIQSPTKRITVNYSGITCGIFLASKDDGQREYGIEIQYHASDRAYGGPAVLLPRGFNTISLVNPNNMK